MVSFLVSIVVLIIGYLVYGKVTENIFGPDDRKTPAVAVPHSSYRSIIFRRFPSGICIRRDSRSGRICS